jgi:hypothetical protein
MSLVGAKSESETIKQRRTIRILSIIKQATLKGQVEI